MMIAIIDYGIGNLKSIYNMFKKVGVESVITSDSEVIRNADKYLLPGVGSFDHGIKSLKEATFFDILEHEVLVNKKPILGICLGMHLLTNGSEEGELKGLGWIDAETKKFKINPSMPIPHMGWNNITIAGECEIFNNFTEENRFYFVHSFYVECNSRENILAEANYDIDFTCGIRRDNIFGFQFHPEKSHRFGMQLLKNFGEM